MDWLAADEVAPSQLPEWARAAGEVLDGKPYRVTMLAEGVVLYPGILEALAPHAARLGVALPRPQAN